MQRASVWSRMTHWFKPERHSRAGTPGPGSSDPVEGADTDGDEVPDGDGQARALAIHARRRPREDAMVRLEEGFNRVADLCDAIQRHFTSQEDRTVRIADSLETIAGGMSRLAEIGRTQTETLGTIVARLETGNSRADKMEELFHQFSKLTEAQRQALAVVAQQVDSAHKTDQQIVESMGTFQQAIATLGESCSASIESLRGMRADAAATESRLSRLVEQQGKRFLMLFVVTLVLAAAAIAALVVGAVR